MAAYHGSPSSSSDDSNDGSDSAAGSNGVANVFRNDGSFLEMFKKMQNASQPPAKTDPTTEVRTAAAAKADRRDEERTPAKQQAAAPPLVGRRRGMKILPVGKVKKLKTEEEEAGKAAAKDPWAKYLEEVKKYKETYCEGESKVRSLVK